MKKTLQVLGWLALLVLIFAIPAIYGWIVAIAGAGSSCGSTAAWLAWLKLCVLGSYVMLTVTGAGWVALILIVAIIAHIIYIIRH